MVSDLGPNFGVFGPIVGAFEGILGTSFDTNLGPKAETNIKTNTETRIRVSTVADTARLRNWIRTVLSRTRAF